MTKAQALYRKWRPQTFDQVVGQTHITQTLRHAIAAGRISHAYLFAGPRGTGKTTMARLLAKAVNCLHPDPAARPCNQCAICQAITEGRLLDLIEIDAASNRGIDDIRELRDKIHFAPAEARYKVYVIDEVHMLTTEAFNALLKTLEEPPPHALFVLATTDPQKMPATVVSRCQPFDFRRLTVREIVTQLEKLVTAEGLQVEPAVLELIAHQATGAMRDALSLLDQLAAYGGTITLEQAQATLGLGSWTHISAIVEGLARNEPVIGLDAIQRAVEEGADVRQLARQIIDRLRAVLLTRVGGAGLLDMTGEQRAAVEAQARQFSVGALIKAIKLFNQAAGDLRTGGQPQWLLELAYLEAVVPGEAPVSSPSAPVAIPPPPATAKPPGAGATPAGPVRPVERPASAGPMPSRAAAVKTAPVPPPPAGEAGASLTLEMVTAAWETIRARLRKRSVPAWGLLNSSQLAAVEGNTLVLSWKSEELTKLYENVRTKRLVEDVASEVLGRTIATRCIVVKPAGQMDALVEEAKALGGVVHVSENQ